MKYSGRDLRLGLVEASQDKIGSPVDQVLLYCFHYDPSQGKYTARPSWGSSARAACCTLVGLGGWSRGWGGERGASDGALHAAADADAGIGAGPGDDEQAELSEERTA